MNRILLIIILILGSLWAVQPVSKDNKMDADNAPVIKVQISEDSKEERNIKQVDIKSKSRDSKNDQFIDTDSNNVNDQREEDLLKIKQLMRKFNDLFKKDKEKESKK